MQPADPAMLSIIIQHEETEIYFNQHLKISPQNPERETCWLLTPEERSDHSTYTPLQQRINQ